MEKKINIEGIELKVLFDDENKKKYINLFTKYQERQEEYNETVSLAFAKYFYHSNKILLDLLGQSNVDKLNIDKLKPEETLEILSKVITKIFVEK